MMIALFLPMMPAWEFNLCLALQVLVCMGIMGAANRFRGGGLVTFDGETVDQAFTQRRRIAFCLVGGGLAALVNWTWWMFPAVAVALYLPYLTGHGRPQGAAGGWNSNLPLEEFTPFDVPAAWLTKKMFSTETLDLSHQKTWGTIWLTLWGAVAGTLVCAATLSCYPLPLFATIGFVFQIVGNIVSACGGNRTVQFPEWSFGIVQGLAIGLTGIRW